MSSNHVGLRSVWKSLVASCVCVCVCGLSSNARFNAFISSAKRVCLLIRSWFRNPPKKEQKLGKKVSVKLDFK